MKNSIFIILMILFILSFLAYESHPNPEYHPIWETMDVKIIRDSIGVPHIYGKTDAETAYGLGYAHMEDDSKTILDVVLSSKGLLATFYGQDLAPADYFYHLLKIKSTVDDQYEKQLEPKTQKLLDFYAEGINTYLYKFPSEKGNIVYPVTGKDVVSGFLMKTPLFFGLDKTIKDLFTKKKADLDNYLVKHSFKHLSSDVVGSNVIATNKIMNSDGSTRIFINSHQPWDGPVAWYEAHLMSDEGQNIIGGLFPGSPVVLHGHNENLGWAHTVNKPSLVDVYKLTVNPDNENQYLLDGKWIDFEMSEARINVNLLWKFNWVFTEKVYNSTFGPVIKNKDEYYTIQYTNRQNINTVEQWYKMGKSSSLNNYFNKLKAISIPMFNIGYADKYGNIAYIYNAKIPKRTKKYSRKIISVSSSDYLWKSYVEFDHLPQIKNPKSGVIFNANNSPFVSTIGNNLNPNDYKDIINVIDTNTTNRGFRFEERLNNHKTLTRNDFLDIKYDLKYSKRSKVGRIIDYISTLNFQNDTLNAVKDEILSWDLSIDKMNKRAAISLISVWPLLNDVPFDKNRIKNQMKEAYRILMKHYSSIQVKWETVNLMKRGKYTVGLDGGPDIIRAIYGEVNDGKIIGTAGDSYILLGEWDSLGNVKSFSRHQYGAASTNKDSEAYDNQVIDFSKNTLKENNMNKNYWKTVQKFKTYHPINGE